MEESILFSKNCSILTVTYQNASTVFCSQFEPSGWYEQIGEATLADAILDRVIHNLFLII
ncbi:ATP-binding protein [Rossellomorea aquimaris]|uniref:ATP-binding protein n=1 Tax=Rossellomorea aquimaris TaxID=189382 RepID=UPI002852F307|nr:ATP-binding protein [Rossellomorea aquimaris]